MTARCALTLTLYSDSCEALQMGFAAVMRGPPGPPGPPGDGSGGALTPEAIGALAVAMRLGEFDTPAARAAARANLGLETVDGGTF